MDYTAVGIEPWLWYAWMNVTHLDKVEHCYFWILSSTFLTHFRNSITFTKHHLSTHTTVFVFVSVVSLQSVSLHGAYRPRMLLWDEYNHHSYSSWFLLLHRWMLLEEWGFKCSSPLDGWTRLTLHICVLPSAEQNLNQMYHRALIFPVCGNLPLTWFSLEMKGGKTQ